MITSKNEEKEIKNEKDTHTPIVIPSSNSPPLAKTNSSVVPLVPIHATTHTSSPTRTPSLTRHRDAVHPHSGTIEVPLPLPLPGGMVRRMVDIPR